ncbi:MAG: hypothetical protein M3527_03455, partial [Actinomycetota bacterium]|nr:hypothetical protein [Actinomycetota bacterium]
GDPDRHQTFVSAATLLTLADESLESPSPPCAPASDLGTEAHLGDHGERKDAAEKRVVLSWSYGRQAQSSEYGIG